MAAVPYYTSASLIAAVKRKILVPTSQVTFTDLDILAFANEEMAISQVPSVLQYHQEYYVYEVAVPLIANQAKYPIPDRAIGMKLRELFWKDDNGNYYEMTRIMSEDKAFYSRNIGANEQVHKYYIEGNDVVLTPLQLSNPTGTLNFFIFIRPNQLVLDNRSAHVVGFNKTITIDNTQINAGDYLTISNFNSAMVPTIYTYTAVTGTPLDATQFQIGTSNIDTATNLSLAILASGAMPNATNGTPSTNVVILSYNNITSTFVAVTSNNQPSLGMNVQAGQGVQFDVIPSIWQNPVTLVNEPLFANNVLVDFLQTKAGHKIKNYDVLIPTGGITGTTINFSPGDVPKDLIIGDYIALANECIIPFLPPDLQNGLAERAAARILAALGDQIGLQMSQQKIQDIDARQGNLIDNRVNGNPLKVTGRNSLLRQGKRTTYRRF